MSARSTRHCKKRSLKQIVQPEMLWERGCGRRDVTNLREAQPWGGRTEDSAVAMKMDSRSPTGFKAGRTLTGKFGAWQDTADYAWQADMKTVTKLTVKSVSEVFPVVSEAWTSTIR